MNELEVNSREVYRHRVPVTSKGTIIRWQFHTKKKSIKFGLEYENVLNNTYFLLLPCERYDADKAFVTGSHVAETPGIYVLVFDNSFSKTTPKHLTFSVELEKGASSDVGDLLTKYEGWLYLTKHRSWKGWRRRWFTLEDGMLQCSREPGSTILAAVDLRSAMISIAPHQRLINIDNGEMLFHLRAMTEGAFNEWVQRIKTCKVSIQESLLHGLEASFSATPGSHQLDEGQLSASISDNANLPPATIQSLLNLLKSLQPSPSNRDATDSSPESHITEQKSHVDSLVQIRDLLLMAQLFQGHLQNAPPSPALSHSATPSLNFPSSSVHPPSLSTTAKRVASAYFHRKDGSSGQSSACSSKRGSFANLPHVGLPSPQPRNQIQDEMSLSSLSSCLSEAVKLLESTVSSLSNDEKARATIIQQALQLLTRATERNSIHARTAFARFTSTSSIKDEFYDAMEALNVNDGLLTEYSAESDFDANNYSIDQLVSIDARSDQHGKEKDDEVSSDESSDDNEAYASFSSSSENEFYTIHARRHTAPNSMSNVSSPVRTHKRGPSLYPTTATAMMLDVKEAHLDGIPISKEEAITADAVELVVPPHQRPSSSSSLTLSQLQPFVGRKKLPAFAKESHISVLSLLRKNVGKDLAKITMPVHFNEPLSALQRMSEKFEYCDLLKQATLMEDSLDRLVHVAAFAVASNASNYGRTWKPFNPLLGETFEYIRPDKGFRFISEKVSHHPLITACHAEGENYSVWQTGQVKSKFWGKSIELTPQGYVHCQISNYDDHYVWNEITSCMHNVISGKKWIEMYGEMTVKNLRTGEMCRLNFKESSFFSDTKNEVVGTVYNAQNEKVRFLSGKWNEVLFEEMDEHQLYCLWRAHPPPPNAEKYYGFGEFAMNLNEMTDSLSKTLPKTDSRFRSDIRLVEEGKLDAADTIKGHLEQKQRNLRQQLEDQASSAAAASSNKKSKGHNDWQPLWFTPQAVPVDLLTGKAKDDIIEYVQNGMYWEARKNQTYPTSFFANFDL